jgi:hypothetical protein
MNFRTLILLLLLPVSMTVCAQTPSVVPTTALDVYANFVGDWVGTVQNLHNGAVTTEAVELRVTETPKQDAMHFEYTHSDCTEMNFGRFSRFITLNPTSSEVTSQYGTNWQKMNKGRDKGLFNATGLAKFAETGYGTFTFSGKSGIPKFPFYRCTFRLSPNTFSYENEASSDGKAFKTTYAYTFNRKKADTTTAQTKQTASQD